MQPYWPARLIHQGCTDSDMQSLHSKCFTIHSAVHAGPGMGRAAEAAASIQQRRNYGAKPVGLMTKRTGTGKHDTLTHPGH